MKTLGFIGTGGMGSGMAANLIKAGYRLVVTDLNRAQAKGLEGQGAEFKDSPRAVAELCELVLSMLPNNDAVRAVGLGKGGLAEATTGSKVWIDFSSIDKETIVGVSDELTKKGWTVVDASAGGVEEVAAAGELALWVSGSKALFDEHQPIFKAMGKSILHVGELGNAKMVKNAMAMLAAVQHLSFAEICSWLRKGGLDAATFQTIIKTLSRIWWRPGASWRFWRAASSSRASPGCQRMWASGSIWRARWRSRCRLSASPTRCSLSRRRRVRTAMRRRASPPTSTT